MELFGRESVNQPGCGKEYRLSFGRTLSAPLQIISLFWLYWFTTVGLDRCARDRFRLPATRCHKTKHMKVGF
jgi:hypothetical protein